VQLGRESRILLGCPVLGTKVLARLAIVLRFGRS
jgi:hypothetical protein